MSEVTPLLPALVTKNEKYSLREAGKWIYEDTTLKDISDTIDKGGNEKATITSIPDVWARVELFKNALFEKHETLSDNDEYETSNKQEKKQGSLVHIRSEEEWRGILAIIGLRRLKDFKGLSVLTISLDLKSYKGESDRLFCSLLSKVLPKEFENSQSIQLLVKKKSDSYEMKTLAIFSPETLVCPAIDLETIGDEIPWWTIYGIKDPAPMLSVDEKLFLAKWLKDIATKYKDSGRSNPNLQRVIKEYIADLNPENKHMVEQLVEDKASPLSSNGLDGIFKILNYSYMYAGQNGSNGNSDEDFFEDSKVIIKSLYSDKQLLILAKDMGKQWDCDLQSIVVGSYINARSVMPTANNYMLDNHKIAGIDLNKYSAEIILGEELFTEKLGLVLKLDFDDVKRTPFPKALHDLTVEYKGAEWSVVIPIKAKYLEFFKPTDITRYLQIENRDNKFVVSFLVSLPGGELRIEKIYEKDNILENQDSPVITVWPNFIVNWNKKEQAPIKGKPFWKTYYTYYDNLLNSTFGIRPIWKFGTSTEISQDDYKEHYEGIVVEKGEAFPEGFVCIDKSSGEEFGVVLLNKPYLDLEGKGINEDAIVGVDFGTTNTVIHYSMDGGATTNLMQFNDMLFHVTEYISDSRAKNDLRRYFISTLPQPSNGATSIRTILHRYEGAYANDEVIKLQPQMFDGNIYYLDGSSTLSEDINIKGRLVNGDKMKWNEDGKRDRNCFLSQLIMQALAKVVSLGAPGIKIVYSYPKSLTPQQLADIDNFWNNMAEENIANDGLSNISILCDNINTSKLSMEESKAVSRFFRYHGKNKASLTNGFMCLDIGGGSTDIAIWKNSEKDAKSLQYQTSVMFAGLRILNNYIWEKKNHIDNILGFIKTKDDSVKALITKILESQNEDDFNRNMEALLKYNEDVINAGISGAGIDDNGTNSILKDLTFALAGLFYYAGICQGFVCKDTYDENFDMPNCYVAGNASKLLNWVAKGYFKSDSAVAAVFENIFVLGLMVGAESEAQPNDTFNIFQTDVPKEEVARGMISHFDERECVAVSNKKRGKISPFKGPEKTVEDSVSVLAGEDFTYGTNKDSVHANQNLDVKQLQAGVKVSDLEKFTLFVNYFTVFVKDANLFDEGIVFSKEEIKAIKTHVNDVLNEKQSEANKNPDQITIEPIFIIEMREAMDILAKR